MKTIAFYSHKGGVGRSLSLVNLAFIMSTKYGKKVGLIDLDVESSGLHQILNVQVDKDRDLLNFLLPVNREIGELDKYVAPISWYKDRAAGVYLIPSLGDSGILNQIIWDQSVDVFLKDELFRTFGSVYHLDYLFIDGRTGLSKFSAFALKQSDLVILFFRLDKQNEFGIGRMIKVCKAAGKPFLTVVSSCPTMIGYKKKIQSFKGKIGSDIDHVLPYMGDLYFREYLVCSEKPKTQLSKAYYSLAEGIVKKSGTNAE